jgi:hypothetical protein
LCLGLCAFAELYSAGETALDRFAPSWERVLGWFLFLLPIELIAALILLFNRKNGRLGFNLTALNLVLYAGFMVVDVFAGHAYPIVRADWLMMGLWAIFFALVLFSAWLIRVGSRPLGKPVIQGLIETIHLRG